MLSLQKEFQVTLKPSQLSNEIDPETKERLYKITYLNRIRYVQYPQFRFKAPSLEIAASRLDPNEYIELK